jgi:hypothetical protein
MHRAVEAMPASVGMKILDWTRTLRFKWYRDLKRANRDVFDALGRPGNVLAGPFAGMAYITGSSGSAFLPKIVGTYEMELAPAIGAIAAGGHDVIVDIGAAEGYYAVGLARANVNAKVIAFEAHKPARHLLKKLARLNGVESRIELRGYCGVDDLAAAIASAQRPAVICDCEGGEMQLLDPVRVPALSRAAILVELHDWAVPGITAAMRERFEKTHEIELIEERLRSAVDLPGNVKLTEAQSRAAMEEHRNEKGRWFWMKKMAE